MEDRLFFDPHQPFDVTERKLPHWNQNNKFYFVTFRLADAMPTEVMHDYKVRMMDVEKRFPMPRTREQQTEVDRIKHSALEKYLELDYELIAYVIMPNHVHLLLATIGDKPIQSIMNAIKRVSGHRICKLAKHRAPLWQREYYDRLIRNAQHYDDVVTYIINNPRHCSPDSYTLYVRQ